MALSAGPAGAAVFATAGRVGAQLSGAVTPANLELVTLAEDRAVFTWYTGYAGSDDGLGRMEPAPGEAELAWGVAPDRLDQLAAGRATDTPYHVVELTGLEPGRTYYYEARSGGHCRPAHRLRPGRGQRRQHRRRPCSTDRALPVHHPDAPAG